MARKVTKDGGFLFVDEALVDMFVGKGWQVEDNAPTKPQNDDTEFVEEDIENAPPKDKKHVKKRFEK